MTDMSDILPDAVREGLEQARLKALRRSSRLSIQDGTRVLPVLRLWDGGFSVAAGAEVLPRGFVDLYDGPRHLYQCLVVASQVEGAERVYDFKWNAPVTGAPAADYVRDEARPEALIPAPARGA
ncbi:hypothetical protein [Pseudoroseicyclus aestuarii]|uniref:Uncharacterized protein n=1 Tax=Pseudoroseicyclus aestuarii TaxID=1795041 RepID=A0A318SV85_9RHOB|nr:hypothetical protein [Pseudoroseicyclus aestuarii]PYE84269.1 hypothetical protein DFP88_10264 [Pseudoroseicyclus aestuarii]